MLYKYPQAGISYERLVDENRASRDPESAQFGLLDTGIFDDNRYFDIFIEYAKATPERPSASVITIHNRGPDAAEIPRVASSGSATRGHWDKGQRPAPSDA